jgi:LmbE family N-acetylglucosaminyl deacetylase
MPFPGDRPAQEGQPIHIRVPIEDRYETKLAAYFAHRTQLDHEAYFRTVALLPTEDYFVALGAPAEGEDLFEGIASA